MERSDTCADSAVDSGNRLVDGSRILVEDSGLLQYALDGFPCGQLSREKAVHTTPDEEGFFVLQVQAGQDGEIVGVPVTHVYMVRIPAALSIGISRPNGDIRERGRRGCRRER